MKWLLLSIALFSVPSFARFQEVVTAYASQVAPGTIVISARERALYFTLDNTTAIRYPVAVPKLGKEWSGSAQVIRKVANPVWQAPDDVRRDHPELPAQIAADDPRNPMGVAAIELSRPEIAIHGTSDPMRKSIGTAASYGCIRMLNEDVVNLFQYVNPGTPVVLIR
jgi:lipoprotein-anchoring transpeptidase ErfK/SrfK